MEGWPQEGLVAREIRREKLRQLMEFLYDSLQCSI